MQHSSIVAKTIRRIHKVPATMKVAVFLVTALGGALSAYSIVGSTDIQVVKNVHDGAFETVLSHMNQSTLNSLVQGGNVSGAFAAAFEQGDVMFSTSFNAIDGGGAKADDQGRYTRVPRADEKVSPEWFTHVPARATGPNAQSCTNCHHVGGDDGAGDPSNMAVRDPLRGAQLGQFITRDTPHLFGLGGLQRLGEEMTVDLQNIRNNAGCNCTSTSTSTPSCSSRTVTLTSKGISFGTATVSRSSSATKCTVVVNAASGTTKAVSSDLVVRPMQWKGSVAFTRDFARGAGHNEIGMQGVELFSSDSQDGDGDAVSNELTVGDITSWAVYIAGQPRPTTRQELASLGLIPALTSAENSAITRGSSQFTSLGCAACHTPQLTVNNAIFSEPSTLPDFRDSVFPGGRSPSSLGLSVTTAIKFNLTTDLLENADIVLPNGNTLGNFERTGTTGAVVRLFGDLRRHDMGSEDIEQIDEIGTGASVFITENLWGVGSTAPYLHDGRATTITEAILDHSGEGSSSRTNFRNASTASKQDLVAFLNNLVLFKAE